MDLQTVEQQYNQLQQEAQGVMQSLQALAGKLKTAADGGNQDAREWLLDLKELALNIQQEQQQVMMVMQAGPCTKRCRTTLLNLRQGNGSLGTRRHPKPCPRAIRSSSRVDSWARWSTRASVRP